MRGNYSLAVRFGLLVVFEWLFLKTPSAVNRFIELFIIVILAGSIIFSMRNKTAIFGFYVGSMGLLNLIFVLFSFLQVGLLFKFTQILLAANLISFLLAIIPEKEPKVAKLEIVPVEKKTIKKKI